MAGSNRPVAHFGIAVAGGESGGRDHAAAGPGHAGARKGAIAMIFRQHGTRNIDLAAAYMRVQIDGARMTTRPPNRIHHRRACWTGRDDDAAAIDKQIADRAVDTVYGS